MRVAFASVIAATATLALAQPRARGHKSINPDISVVQSFGGWETVTAEPQPVTNAERFARNLPPLKPKAHRRRPHRGGPHTGTRVKSAPRAESSPLPPMSKRCLLKVTGVDSTAHGFVSSQFNDFGEYAVQENQDGALEVTFSYAADSPSQIDFTTVNGQQSVYPYFGAIGGPLSDSDDLDEGDNSYLVIGGTSKTSAGSTPGSDGNTYNTVAKASEKSESAIWKYDPVSQAITVQWINSDGSAPANHILFANDSNNSLIITGDVAAFQAEYDTYPEVVFACVPPASSEVVPT